MYYTILGGSWVVISRDISRVTILITHIRGLLAPLITTPDDVIITRSPSDDIGNYLGFYILSQAP